MRTQSRPARPRRRAVIVAVLVMLGALASVGIGHAQPATAGPAPTAAAVEDPDKGKDGDGKVCADGKRDDNPADGTCTRDGDKKDGDKKDEGKKDEGKKDDGKKDDGKKDGGEGTVCADGKRDNNAADGVCTRDGGKPPPEDPNLAKGTPCTKSADACVDLAADKTWLIDGDGNVMRGPVPIGQGGPGFETPRGDFVVHWKNRDHRSMEFDNAPMPFAVFFTDGGIAFHEGDVNGNSHGCVRLPRADAEAWFNFLEVDDVVQVR